jgi:iron complex outermembrane receptor protein
MRLALLSGASALAICLVATAATAQSNATTSGSQALEEVVVTARKREERLSEVPTAASVLDSRSIADRGGLVTLSDLIKSVPSVNFANTSTPQTAEISMRGSATARATNAEAGVGLYRNGAYIGGGRIGGRTFTRMDFFDPERIEVLRGVQGGLYGRNAVGGAINLISARPAFEYEGWASAKYGRKELQQVQAVGNIPLADGLAIRLGVDYQDQDKGFFYNPVQQRYFDEQHAEGVRGQVRLNKGPVDINVLAERSYAHLPALNFQIFIPVGTPGFPNGAFQPQYSYGWNGNMEAKQNQENLVAQASFDLGVARLYTTAAHRKRETTHAFDGDGIDPVFLAQLRAKGGGLTTDAGQAQLQYDNTTNRYVELHLTDIGESRLKWLVGLEHLEVRSASLFVATRTPTTANPSPGTRSPAQLNTTSDAVFGSLGVDVTERFNISGELRNTRDKKNITAARFDLRTGLVAGGAPLNFSRGGEESNTSYTVTASYKLPWKNALLYAKQGTAYRAGGFNTDLGDSRAPNPVTAAFGNESSTAYELGFKGRILEQVFFTAAIFQTDTDDILVQDQNGCALSNPVCPATNTPFLRNGGKARTRGAEVEATGRFEIAGGRLRLTVGGARIDADIVSGLDAGKKIPQVPDWTATISANYVRSLTDSLAGFVNLQGFARQGGVQEIAQTPELRDYESFDLRFGLRAKGWEFAAYSDNVSDTRYIVYSTATSRRWNTPRTYGVEITKRW